MLGALLGQHQFGNVAVHRNHARHPALVVPEGRAGRQEVARPPFHGQGFGEAGHAFRLVHGQGMRHQAAGQIRRQLAVGQAAQLLHAQARHPGVTLVGIVDHAAQVIEHNARRQRGIDPVHDLLLLVDHQIEAAHLVGHGAFLAAHQPPPQGHQYDAGQGRHQSGGDQHVFAEVRVLGLGLGRVHALHDQPGHARHGQGQGISPHFPALGRGLVAQAQGQTAAVQAPAGQLQRTGTRGGIDEPHVLPVGLNDAGTEYAVVAGTGDGPGHGQHIIGSHQDGNHPLARGIHIEGREDRKGHVHDQFALLAAHGQHDGPPGLQHGCQKRPLVLAELRRIGRSQINLKIRVQQIRAPEAVFLDKILQLPEHHGQARSQAVQGIGVARVAAPA